MFPRPGRWRVARAVAPSRNELTKPAHGYHVLVEAEATDGRRIGIARAHQATLERPVERGARRGVARAATFVCRAALAGACAARLAACWIRAARTGKAKRRASRACVRVLPATRGAAGLHLAAGALRLP